jgi:hypothetical protein
MDFFVGGYFLVQGIQRADWMNKKLMPAKFWTVSRCICELYPDVWAFNWSSRPSDDYPKILNLDDKSFESLQTWADELMTKDELGWPSVFLNIATARQFYSKYLNYLPDIKLLSIALPETYLAEYIEENKPETGLGGLGVYQKLQQREFVSDDAIARGFEILGEEYGGQFHSFVCNSLETNYSERLGISLNQHGLIDRYEDAVKATDYTNLDEVGAEPVLWQPWSISEHPLEAPESN